jgi:TolB-like protein
VLPLKRSRGWPTALVTFAALLVLGVLGFQWVRRDRPQVAENGPHSVVVLPLRAIGDTGLHNVAEVLSEELSTVLAADTLLRVLAPIRGYDPLATDLTSRRHQTAYIADGGVQQGSDRIRITLRLVRTRDAVVVWATPRDLAPDELSTVAKSIAAEISAVILANR